MFTEGIKVKMVVWETFRFGGKWLRKSD